MEIVNAKINGTMLGIESHDIMSFFLYLDFGGSGQGFGGYGLDEWVKEKDRRVGTAYGLDLVMKILDVVGVEKWEDLKGKHIRVQKENWHSPIKRIGHIIEDKWFDIEEHGREHGIGT